MSANLCWQANDFWKMAGLFHEMVQRDILGVAIQRPGAVQPPGIARWWQNFQTYQPAQMEGRRFAEKTLVGEIGRHTLVATYDLIVITPDDKAIIFDWKTWKKRHGRDWIDQRLQTRVYPYLLAQVSQSLGPGLQLVPENISMQYWFAEFPDNPETIAYSDAAYEEDHRYLEALVNEVVTTGQSDYLLTEDEKKCTFCPYRSYCDRGDVAGSLDEDIPDDTDLAIELLGDLDDYESIAF